MTKVTEIREMAIPPGNVCNTKNRFQRVFWKILPCSFPRLVWIFDLVFFLLLLHLANFLASASSFHRRFICRTNVCFVVTGNPGPDPSTRWRRRSRPFSEFKGPALRRPPWWWPLWSGGQRELQKIQQCPLCANSVIFVSGRHCWSILVKVTKL